MSEKIKIHLGGGYQIRHKGVFNINKLYKEMYSWINSNKYDFLEKYHSHKKRDIGDEILLEWVAEREITDFIKFYIKTDFRMYRLSDVSEELVEGNATITFKAFLILDYKEKWATPKFKQFLYKLYTKIFYKDDIKRYKEKLISEVKEFHNTAKEVLEFHR